MTAVAVEPVHSPVGEAAGRILGYDVARSMALLGMIVVHFGLVMAADPTRPAWSAMIMHVLDGRAAATFVVLAGVGLTLRSRRAVAAEDPRAIAPVRATLIRRGLFLLVLGFVNLVIWPGDILRVYGVSLIVAAGLITASDRPGVHPRVRLAPARRGLWDELGLEQPEVPPAVDAQGCRPQPLL
jgi:uncharacterized membrane protein YeiB